MWKLISMIVIILTIIIFLTIIISDERPAKEFNLKVVTKTEDHPKFGKGSVNGYKVNGIQGDTIILKRNKQYVFNVEGSSLYFTTSESGGPGLPGNLISEFEGATGRILLDVKNFFPSHFFYQSTEETFMGGSIVIQG